jgi:cell shape-determining protein MreC
MFSLQATTEKWGNALRSYNAVVAARDSALLAALQVPALRADNDRLGEMLMLAGRLDWGFIPARVLPNTALGAQTTITIAAGSAVGVKVLAPVIGTAGIVGVVSSVDRNTSVVNLWAHPVFAAGAMSEDGRAFGIVAPHLAIGTDPYLLEMRNVPLRDTLREGTRIVASGTGGVYPAMTPIGTIVRELETGNNWARTYLVRVNVRPHELTSVIILDPARAAAGVREVWPSLKQVDSLARAAARRGDSLARVRHAAEVKAIEDSVLLQLRALTKTTDTLYSNDPSANRTQGKVP